MASYFSDFCQCDADIIINKCHIIKTSADTPPHHDAPHQCSRMTLEVGNALHHLREDVCGVAAAVDPVHLKLASLVRLEDPMLPDIDMLRPSTVDAPPFDDLNARR